LTAFVDEILVNAADNYHRDNKMTQIRVKIDEKKGEITVWNNGKGLPVEIHSKEKVYVPELVFGHMLTSSNYDDSMKKVTGGRNGFGAKLTNIFSKKFAIQTADSKNRKKYTQEFKGNLTEIGEPTIAPIGKEDTDFTEVSFQPDFKKFHMKCLDRDTCRLLSKRVIDLAGVTASSVKVYLNGTKVKVDNFKQYCEMFIAKDAFRCFDSNPKWDLCITASAGSFGRQEFS
jgi:DNA topoisomerase II